MRLSLLLYDRFLSQHTCHHTGRTLLYFHKDALAFPRRMPWIDARISSHNRTYNYIEDRWLTRRNPNPEPQLMRVPISRCWEPETHRSNDTSCWSVN
ncbi:hypothetical protein E2C01_025869 [Portunus trituberculatus]|uniref:Uncharacterized protein n=1 Tax=Portunus trituberculatus TaxID=210409 RepID=A0A5B7EGN7_PORTR|nr:hypothetical protein [Portunus trituberculatus]